MESLIKQKRVSFSESKQDSKEEANSTKNREKSSRNWLQRQFSTQMTRDFDSNDEVFAAAVAAAAFAIHSLEEADLETPMAGVRTQNDGSFRLPEPKSASRRHSGKEAKDAVEASMRKPMGQYTTPAPPALEVRKQKVDSTRQTSAEAKTDAWEKAAMAKIRKRYEKMSSAILVWENEKKKKAKLQMERKKSELDQRRARNIQHYQNKLARINLIADGARAQMEQKRRDKENGVKERPKKMRSTGKGPVTCLCF